MPDGSAMTLATGRKGDKLTRTVGRVIREANIRAD